jgi:hypothetical protein
MPTRYKNNLVNERDIIENPLAAKCAAQTVDTSRMRPTLPERPTGHNTLRIRITHPIC